MSALSRADGNVRPAPAVRLVHLGLGNFFRAHQAWYTDTAPDASEWGYAAFTGRVNALAAQLSAQDGLYTLVTRGAAADDFRLISTLSRVHAADDHEAWLGYLGSPLVSAVTVTVTEAGYVRRPDGKLDVERPALQADLTALQRDLTAIVRTVPARLVAGLAARRRAGAGPISVVPCDNLPGNGAVVADVLGELAGLVDPGLAHWIAEAVSIVSTTVDRITPRPGSEVAGDVIEATGVTDACPVVTEPFTEWILSGAFPAGRPEWDAAGAVFTTDVAPYEQRKLWLLNGAHSLLAYAGSLRGHLTVAEAIADETCRAWVEQWWSEAAPLLGRPGDDPNRDIAAYCAALLARFANPRIHHQLAQIAADGSQKLPVRILPVLRRERAAGRLPEGALRVLAAWIGYLRGAAADVADVDAERLVPLAAGTPAGAVRRVLGHLDVALADDSALVGAVADQLADSGWAR